MDWVAETRIRQEIGELNARFCRHIDRCENEALVELFTPDVLYTHGPRVSRGRDELAQVFARRTARGPRTSRHLQTGLMIDIESDRRATGTSVCTTFGADGLPPIRSTRVLLVADFEDVYRRGDDGRWRIAERHIHRIFEDEASGGPIGMAAAPASGGRG